VARRGQTDEANSQGPRVLRMTATSSPWILGGSLAQTPSFLLSRCTSTRRIRRRLGRGEGTGAHGYPARVKATFGRALPSSRICMRGAARPHCHTLVQSHLELGRAPTRFHARRRAPPLILVARNLRMLAFVCGMCRWSAKCQRFISRLIPTCTNFRSCSNKHTHNFPFKFGLRRSPRRGSVSYLPNKHL
jgi:hypothetical protein